MTHIPPQAKAAVKVAKIEKCDLGEFREIQSFFF
jgi:hypothetical protein